MIPLKPTATTTTRPTTTLPTTMPRTTTPPTTMPRTTIASLHRMLAAAPLWLVSCWLAAWPGPAAAADLWEGTLGTSPIVLTLDPAAGQPSGQYFYRRHRHGIELSGSREADGGLRLEEWVMTPGGGERPLWHLRAPRGDVLEGQWSGGGKDLPIVLRRVATDALPATDDPGLAELRAQDAFRYLQLHGLPLRAGQRQTVGDYRLQWWREPRSGIELFRVLSGYPEAQLPAINRTLARRHWDTVQAYLDCTATPMSDFAPSTTLRHIGRHAISVSLLASYYCGGAHPDQGDTPLNLDPRTGRALALEDVLWLGEGTPPARGDDRAGGGDNAWFEYRDTVLAPWLVAQMQRLHPRQAAGEDGSECDYSDPEVWDFPTWYVSADGLYLDPYFARAFRVCDDPGWSVLPWSLVRAHAGAVRIAPGGAAP